MKELIVLLLVASLMILTAGTIAPVTASENKGAKDIELYGGTRGNIAFPHHLHQKSQGDCQICHSIFEQRAGSIKELKAQGKLEKKYVMNKLCTQCHKEKKKAGEKSGPTACSKCHVK